MKTCQSCQSANLDGVSTCSVCGTPLGDFTIAPQPPQAQPPQARHPGTARPDAPPDNRSGYATPQNLTGPPPSGPALAPPGQLPPPPQYPAPSQFPPPPQYPGQGATVYAPPGTPGGYVQTSPTNNLAIASLVMSIVGIVGGFMCFVPALLAPAGAIAGHVALNQIKSSGQAGRGLALAGVIVGWIATLVIAALVVLFVVAMVASSGSSY